MSVRIKFNYLFFCSLLLFIVLYGARMYTVIDNPTLFCSRLSYLSGTVLLLS